MQGALLGVGSEEKGEKDCKFQLFVEKKKIIFKMKMPLALPPGISVPPQIKQ